MIPERVIESVPIGAIVPIRVTGMLPDFVAGMLPDLVVGMAPDLARAEPETARTKMIVQEIDVTFFIVSLLVNRISGVRGRPEGCA